VDLKIAGGKAKIGTFRRLFSAQFLPQLRKYKFLNENEMLFSLIGLALCEDL
jgi:hypothetical protein